MIRDQLDRVTGGAAAFPLLILFALNAVDELDRAAFGILVPEIRDHFGLDNQGILGVIALVSVIALGGQVLIGYYADRGSRVRIALGGATAWGLFTLATGLAPAIALLIVARSGTALGRAVNDPTHNSLLADFYPPEARVRVYGFHRFANPLGLFLGPLLGGGLAALFGTWRAPFLIFWIPTLLLVIVAAIRLRDPVRGNQERRVMGATEEAIATEEASPSLGEAWRICYQVKTLRRIWYSLPFLSGAFYGLVSVFAIFYEEVFDLSEVQRGTLFAFIEIASMAGILIGVPIAAKLSVRHPGLVLRFIAVAGIAVAAGLVGFAIAPNLGIAIAMHVLITAPLAVLTPGIYSVLSLAIPPRARALGFAIGSLYVLPGLIVLPLIGGLADDVGVRPAIMFLVPVFMIGAAVIASAGSFVEADIHKVRTSTVAQAEVRAARERGEAKLLLVKNLDVSYDTVQVLFNVDFEVDEGEIVALLGTNGAGKSTLLKAISGIVEAGAGAVVFDGRDMTYATPHEIAARGVVQVPGGKGVFPSLTVAENLKIAGWLYQRDDAYLKAATERVLEFFPVLRERWDQPAGNLSGGEQQMVTLAQAFIAKPRLLMIDELSLGLAPIIVEQLLEIVRAIRDQGTTIILVEQSVNVALTVAHTAYFMEKGEIRFNGPTSELLERPDVLRSVFLEGAGAAIGASSPGPKRRARPSPRRQPDQDRPILEAIGVTKAYGGITAVGDVSFRLGRGEILGIIGPNGAGKTTLFDLISGYVAADSGRVVLDGFDVTDLPPDARARLGLGRSFQDARLFPAMTVRDTIALALERHVEVRDPIAAALNLPLVGDSERKVMARVEELIEMMGVGAFADKFVA
ncbi:MAG TPA: MFS transporter [Acidimicrobiales bacterium]|nr:MFS transporter [Acidimicrobiales bacterium]